MPLILEIEKVTYVRLLSAKCFCIPLKDWSWRGNSEAGRRADETRAEKPENGLYFWSVFFK